MTATAGTTAQTDVDSLVLAALDPGPFGPATEPAPSIAQSRLFEAEGYLEKAAAIFGHLDEHGLRDDTNSLIGRLLERLADDQPPAVEIEVQL